MSRLFSSLLLSLGIASSAPAVTMDWTAVGDPGNACESTPRGTLYGGCFGSVGYAYSIGTYEVTNAQYAEFLNAKAASDPLELYSISMSTIFGGITRSGSSSGYTYSTIAGRENMPVNLVSFYDALRFANWMNNGQGSGDTETGAYTLLGGTATPSNGTTVARNPGATIVLTSEDEWYKAAYYDASSGSYFEYPAGSDAQMRCSGPTATPNRANCGFAVGNLSAKGSYVGSPSRYGTFDQGGNVFEWNEAIINDSRGFRGGAFDSTEDLPSYLAASFRGYTGLGGGNGLGFRLAMVPEPGPGLLVIAGLLGLAGSRRARI